MPQPTRRIKQKNKYRTMLRYSSLAFVFFALSSIIIGKLFLNTKVNASEWNRVAKEEMSKRQPTDPMRGNILSDNGNILACNLQVFDLKIDIGHNRFAKKKPSRKSLDSLADSLDVHFPRVKDFDKLTGAKRDSASWRNKLHKEFLREKKNRALLVKKNASEEELETFRNLPVAKRFLKFKKYDDTRNPFYAKDHYVRIYPFGEMAKLSIGRVNMVNGERHGYSGLERDLDSLLYGQTGYEQKMPMSTGMRNWVVQKPVRGYDVMTTINIDMQDMLEEELRKVLLEYNMKWGTAILMEVATGDIKAISNVEKLDDGTIGEAMNRAVLCYEPGSVMKPISLMVAFEDGLVKSANDGVDCSPFQGTSDHHAPPYKTMKQVIEMSSNTGIARVLFRGYKDKPEGFKARLKEMGFFEPFHTGIDVEKRPRIPDLGPKDSRGNQQTMTARLMSLARQTFGYNTMIPPLYTLAMYNAMANDGKFVRPRLIRGLRDENGKDSLIEVQYVRDQVCSPKTASMLRECLRQVVESKTGTGHCLDDDRLAVAGKTGTVFPVVDGKYDKSQRRLAFAGFFPYDRPKYSCIVLVEGPAGAGAARTSGMVLLNMALRLYSRGMLENASSFTNEKIDSHPILATGEGANYEKVRNNLGATKVSRTAVGKDYPAGQVPDVRGYDLRTAISILEKRGIDVSIKGAGRVVHQSMEPGQRIPSNAKITLTLKT